MELAHHQSRPAIIRTYNPVVHQRVSMNAVSTNGNFSTRKRGKRRNRESINIGSVEARSTQHSMIKIHINNQLTPVLLDTGLMITFMRKSLAKSLGLFIEKLQ
jgi:predicted aspartyl protease